MAGPSRGDLLANKRLLIVEDEFLIALDIERIVEVAGAKEIIVTSRREDALKALEGAAFDLAVLDFKLDKDIVLPVAEKLTAAGTPFIFLTGAPDQAARAQEFKNVPIVTKPFDSATLLAALSKALGGQ